MLRNTCNLELACDPNLQTNVIQNKGKRYLRHQFPYDIEVVISYMLRYISYIVLYMLCIFIYMPCSFLYSSYIYIYIGIHIYIYIYTYVYIYIYIYDLIYTSIYTCIHAISVQMFTKQTPKMSRETHKSQKRPINLKRDT